MRLILAGSFVLMSVSVSVAQRPDWTIADDTLAAYFQRETEQLSRGCLEEIQTAQDWESHQEEYRRQLREMLGLDPLPQRTELNAVVTGIIEHGDIVVERIQFQSLPGLYVTGNLYRPRVVQEKLPTILYVCGHGRVAEGQISYGNKTHYQHHGAWFARHGYVCLTIDTIQLGEIEGIHHGTYRYGMWWWNSRGYTPAGVEAWNSIRALDYLETRPEVDAARFGITGRSGGGAYSWWAAAIDERIRVAVPVAGITSLRNHVVDGCVEGHCDCMYMVNTYRWDFPQVAALLAPRPLLISNTDKDNIFPLDGVVEIHAKVRRVYELLGKGDQLGLQITEGPHKDTQELHLHAFVWFDRWLKGEVVPISQPADKLFQPAQLRVFGELPADEIVTRIHETFVPAATVESSGLRPEVLEEVRRRTFRGWPSAPDIPPLDVTLMARWKNENRELRYYRFQSDHTFQLPLVVELPLNQPQTGALVVHPCQAEQWAGHLSRWKTEFAELGDQLGVASSAAAIENAESSLEGVHVYLAPRGIGPTDWHADENKQVQIRRRFMLLGQTLDGMRVWDVRRGLQAVLNLDEFAGPVEMSASGNATLWGLFATLYEPAVRKLMLNSAPGSFQESDDFLNILKAGDVSNFIELAKTMGVEVSR